MPGLYRFTVEQFHDLTRLGIIGPDDRVELLEGLPVLKMTKNPRHWIATGLVQDALRALALPGYFVHVQDPVDTPDSVPEPDVALVRGARRQYLGRNPLPHECPLFIEVADTSLAHDRGWKKEIYAKAGIAVYWILNLVDRQLEVHSQPSGPQAENPDFRDRQVFLAADEVPVVLEGREMGKILVADMLP
jgi:Uma2 family endonuclease